MTGQLAVLLVAQLAGEVVARMLALPVPGPVLGLALMVAIFAFRPALADYLGPVARTVLANLSLFFVPAGVGIVGNLDVLSSHWIGFVIIVLFSTVFAMLVSVGTFLLVSRMIGAADE